MPTAKCLLNANKQTDGHIFKNVTLKLFKNFVLFYDEMR